MSVSVTDADVFETIAALTFERNAAQKAAFQWKARAEAAETELAKLKAGVDKPGPPPGVDS